MFGVNANANAIDLPVKVDMPSQIWSKKNIPHMFADVSWILQNDSECNSNAPQSYA